MKAGSIATRLLRGLIPSLGLALALGLSACGGGDGVELAATNGVKRAGLAAVTKAEADQAEVVAVSQVSEKRISRTVFEYVFNVSVLNGALPQTDVQATVASVGTGTTVVDGLVVVGSMAANAQVTSADIITLRHDRTYPFDLAKLTWRVSGTVPLTAQPITVRGVVPERVTTLSTGQPIVMSDLLVMVEESISQSAAAALFAQVGGTIVGRVPEAYLYQLEVLSADTEVKLLAARDALASQPGVLEVSFNGMSQTNAVNSNLPSTVYYPNDQYLRAENDPTNVSQIGYQRSALDAMNAGTAWKALQPIATTMSEVGVGVIDVGFKQEDTSEINIFRRYGPTTANTSVIPAAGTKNNINHGMHVAGIIAANGTLASPVPSDGQVAGLAWQAGAKLKLHVARTDLTDAVQLAHVANLVRARVKVINASLGHIKALSLADVCNIASLNARLILRLAKNYGDFIYVLAAGNEYDKAFLHQPLALLFQPQEIPNCPLFLGAKEMSSADLGAVKDRVLVVANADTTVQGKEALYKSFFGGSNFGAGVEISAPGVDILSLGYESKYLLAPLKLTGTSMAAPQVSAALALAWSINQNLSAGQVKKIVITKYSRRITDHENRTYPLLDLNEVVKASQATVGTTTPLDPTALAPLVIYTTCKYGEGNLFSWFSGEVKIGLNLRISGAGNVVVDEGLMISGSYATALNPGNYRLALQDPTGNVFAWSNQNVTTLLPFTLMDDLSGNVRTIHVQFSAATEAACFNIGPLAAPTATGVNASSTTLPPAATPSLAIDLTPAAITVLGGSGVGSFAYESAALSGRNRPAAKFTAGYLRVPNSSAMQFTDGATFDLWARVDSNTGMNGNGAFSNSAWFMTLLAKSHDRNGVGFLAMPPIAAQGTGFGYVHSATFDPSWAFNGCQTFPEMANVALGSWYRMTIAVSSTTGWRHYVNKQLVHSCPNARPSFAQMNTQDLFIGRFSDNFWYPLNGAVSDIHIYQKALTAAEVTALP